MQKHTAEDRINRGRVSEQAVTVVRKLRVAGFDAYLVGGCVRDLLLDETPKDFDVATDATPEQVREVFRRVRLVGRRFRIAHVRMRREIIEVSTFRCANSVPTDAMVGHGRGNGRTQIGRPSRNGFTHAHVSEDGIILRDNAYGAIHEDAFRRDFTINALYYDPIENMVHDYCDGMADIANARLRVIGDPADRFREDPVRILRAVRFAARLNMRLYPEIEAAIATTRELLASVPPARLFDELGKLFMLGHGERMWQLMRRYRLVETLFASSLQHEEVARLALASTDSRIRQGKPVTPGFLVAAFLWREFAKGAGVGVAGVERTVEELETIAFEVLATQQRKVAIPRRHSQFAREVWLLQPKLEKRTSRNVTKVLAHPRFRAAYDFLMVRVEAGDAPAELGGWWTQAQTEDAEELARRLTPERPRRRRRRRRRSAAGVAQSEAAGVTLSEADVAMMPP